MTRYVLGRLGGAAIVLAVVAVVVLGLFEMLPGDAAQTVLSQSGRSGGVPPRSSSQHCAPNSASTAGRWSGS